MSVEKRFTMICDECGREDVYYNAEDGVRSKVAARTEARKDGWRTGLKATPIKPSLYDVKRDVCPHCQS